MATASNHDEYNTIVSLTRPFSTPTGHTYIGAEHAPLTVLQLCCTRTLARGRILYQVHDAGSSGIVGYVVPTDVSQFAHKYKHGVDFAGWNTYEDLQEQVLRRAYAVLRHRFPRMPEVDAKAISEMALQRRWKYDEEELEEMIIGYAEHQWTAYDFRLSGGDDDSAHTEGASDLQLTPTHEQVFEIVKPRLREVVRSWLPLEVAGRDLDAFYESHDLSDDSSQARECSTAEPRYATTLSSYGGAETIANFKTRPNEFR